LAAVSEAGLHAIRYSTFEIRILQNDVGRLAAQFLRDPLHGGGCCDGDAGSGGSGQGDHVDTQKSRIAFTGSV